MNETKSTKEALIAKVENLLTGKKPPTMIDVSRVLNEGKAPFFIQVPTCMVKRVGLEQTYLLGFIWARTVLNKREWAKLSISNFCKVLDMKARTVARYLNELEEEGYIEKRDGYPYNRFRVSLPRVIPLLLDDPDFEENQVED